jgi:hypothetical protein
VKLLPTASDGRGERTPSANYHYRTVSKGSWKDGSRLGRFSGKGIRGTVSLTFLRRLGPSNTSHLQKTRFSMLTDDVIKELERLGTKSVVLLGIEAHVCVQQTCLDLLAQGLDVFVIADGTSRYYIYRFSCFLGLPCLMMPLVHENSQRQFDRNIAFEVRFFFFFFFKHTC